jgi:hypothetical protein
MSEQPAHQGSGPSRKFVPDVNPLENRFLLSGPDARGGSTGGDDLPRLLPRTGGVFVQTGSELGIGVGQPTTNAVQVTDVHTGNVQAEWNGGPVHSLTGVKMIFVEAERARNDQVTFNLTAPRTGPTAMAVGSHVSMSAVPASDKVHPLNVRRTSGSAVQSGSVLTVMVDRPAFNVVQITNEGAGNVSVEWNGGKAHPFAGVATIVVNASNTTNPRKDNIILTDSGS